MIHHTARDPHHGVPEGLAKMRIARTMITHLLLKYIALVGREEFAHPQ
jgi:hypothetical protein